MSSKTNRARRDGWSDGFAGADDMSCCSYIASETRAAYERGLREGQAAARKARDDAEHMDHEQYLSTLSA